MNDLKKTAVRALCVILAVLLVPAAAVLFSETGQRALSAVKDAAAASAELAMGGDEFAARRLQSAQDILDLYTQAADALTVVNTPSAEFDERLPLYSGSPWAIDMAPDETETPSLEVPVATPSEEILSAIPYPADLEDHDGVIKDVHYARYTGSSFIDLAAGGQVRNCTDLSNADLLAESEKLPAFTIEANSKEPQVLIYHTHTTESFEPYTRDFYDKDFTCKSTDVTMNITAVGDEICKQLDAAGIAYVHDTTVHDYPSYNGSYQSSRETVQAILKKYPSIKVVLDVHRDAIEQSDGTRLAPIQVIDGKRAAQLMIISCCDDGTMNMPNYLKNFRFASLLQSTTETTYPGLTRPVLFDYRFYNQDLTTGSLLVEVGSHGNSIDEVKYTGELFGKALAKALEGISS
ncbi:MAG: stage II sporulation protein P [Oscillospiraceae bacterium]